MADVKKINLNGTDYNIRQYATALAGGSSEDMYTGYLAFNTSVPTAATQIPGYLASAITGAAPFLKVQFGGDSVSIGARSETGLSLWCGMIQFNQLYAPNSDGSSGWGWGTNGQVLKSNGSTVYWGTDNTPTDYLSYTATAMTTNSTQSHYLIGKQIAASNKNNYYCSSIYMTYSSSSPSGYRLVAPIIYATSVYASSDRRLKENIKKSYMDYLNLIKKFNLVTYNWISDTEKITQHGLIAQELQEVLPNELKGLVVTDDHNYLAINDAKLVYVVLGALQQQIQINQELENRIKKLESLVLGV